MSFRTEYINESARQLARDFNPAATAHIGVDLQKGYFMAPLAPHYLKAKSCDYYQQAEKTVDGVASLAETFDSAGVCNIWLRHDKKFPTRYFKNAVSEEYLWNADRKLKAFVEQAAELCVPVTKGVVVDKDYFDGFSYTTLGRELSDRKISTLFLSGGFREFCIAKTITSAKRRGYDIYLIDDLVMARKWPVTEKDREEFCADAAEKNIRVVTADQVRVVLQLQQSRP